MKLVNYRCEKCGHQVEELFTAGEQVLEFLKDRLCFGCKKRNTLKKWNFKNNEQVQKFKGEW